MRTKTIQFGTDGWRAVIAKEFTFENVGTIAQAIADYLRGEQLQNPSIAIGYDTRFMSDLFAGKIANYTIARKNTIDGLKVYFTNHTWMLIRLSQTEPLFRIYCGGNDEKSVIEIITEAEKILIK